MTNVWQKVGSGAHSPNHGQNDESKSGEGSVGNKGGWDTRKGRDDNGDGKEIRGSGDKRCGKAGGHVTVWLMFKFHKS